MHTKIWAFYTCCRGLPGECPVFWSHLVLRKGILDFPPVLKFLGMCTLKYSGGHAALWESSISSTTCWPKNTRNADFPVLEPQALGELSVPQTGFRCISLWEILMGFNLRELTGSYVPSAYTGATLRNSGVSTLYIQSEGHHHVAVAYENIIKIEHACTRGSCTIYQLLQDPLSKDC